MTHARTLITAIGGTLALGALTVLPGCDEAGDDAATLERSPIEEVDPMYQDVQPEDRTAEDPMPEPLDEPLPAAEPEDRSAWDQEPEVIEPEASDDALPDAGPSPDAGATGDTADDFEEPTD